VTRAMVFLGAALLAVSLAPARQASARAVALGPSGIVAALPAALGNSSPGSGTASAGSQVPRATDRTKRIEAVDENLGQDSAPLPQTSTILPLLGLIGLGSLVAGLFARR